MCFVSVVLILFLMLCTVYVQLTDHFAGNEVIRTLLFERLIVCDEIFSNTCFNLYKFGLD